MGFVYVNSEDLHLVEVYNLTQKSTNVNYLALSLLAAYIEWNHSMYLLGFSRCYNKTKTWLNILKKYLHVQRKQRREVASGIAHIQYL